MLEKFQLLVKSYYSLIEQFEQRGPSTPEQIDKLRKAYGHLEAYKENLETLKSKVVEAPTRHLTEEIRNMQASTQAYPPQQQSNLQEYREQKQKKEESVKRIWSTIFRANDRVFLVIKIKQSFMDWKGLRRMAQLRSEPPDQEMMQ